jgi:hypothetical protein
VKTHIGTAKTLLTLLQTNTMVLIIKKNTSTDEVRAILQKGRKKSSKKKKGMESFFGKLPRIADGLAYQKKSRNEWK